MVRGLCGANVTPVTNAIDGSDDRESEVADMARRAAMAASGRRKQARAGGEISEDDVDPDVLVELDAALENLAAWMPGFAGAMLFRGENAQPLVSLITSGERESMRRTLIHLATSTRTAVDLVERGALGSFVDSVTSTTRGAAIVTRLNDDLLVTALEGHPAPLADAWQAIRNNRDMIEAIAARLVPGD